MKQREKMYDAIKYLAIFLVMIDHFLFDAGYSLKNYWHVYPYNLFLYGVGGKLGVGIFAVISGYFAYKAGRKQPFMLYVLKRYFYFVICGFIANCFYYALNYTDIRNSASFGLVIGQAVFLDCLIFTTFWFARSFFAGSIFAFILGKYKIRQPETIFLIIVLVYLADDYTAIYIADCLLGCALYNVLEKDYDLLKKQIVHLLIFIAIFFLMKRDSDDMAYFIWGICGFLLILLVKYNKIFHKIFDNRFMAFYGQRTMALLILHNPFTYYIGLVITGRTGFGLLLYFAAWFAAVHLVAIPLNLLINYIIKTVNNVLDQVYEKAGNILKREND